MRCIFCKEDSTNSRSIEHIIPESLGNKEHILPSGVVCDGCNQYFSRKIEKPLLDSYWFVDARHRKAIPSKKGRIPPIQGMHLQSVIPVEFWLDKNGHRSICARNESDSTHFINSLRNSEKITVIVPSPTSPDEYILSRFLGKVGIEVLAHRVLNVHGGLAEIVKKKELDQLRDYVRWGKFETVWPFHHRELYSEDFIFYGEGYGYYEILHEFTLLYTDRMELYLVVVIFGVEYAINLGGPEITGYLEWLRDNRNRSIINMCH